MRVFNNDVFAEVGESDCLGKGDEVSAIGDPDGAWAFVAIEVASIGVAGYSDAFDGTGGIALAGIWVARIVWVVGVTFRSVVGAIGI